MGIELDRLRVDLDGVVEAALAGVGGAQVEAFNLRLTNGEARITEARMEEFAAVERTAYGLREEAIVRYVAGINLDQAEELKGIYGTP